MSNKEKFENYIILKKNKIKISSKEIKGDVFCTKREKYHGNKFIISAIANGAKFCLTDKIYKSNNEKIIYVKNVFSYLKN